jgi:hypothetical protein
MPQIELGEWLPDQEQVASPGLRGVANFSPSAAGWQGIPESEDSELDALPYVDPTETGECRGAERLRTQTGADVTLAGTNKKLYESSGFSMVDRSRGAAYTLSPTDRWELKVYGDARFATNKSDAVQRSATPGSAFADLNANASLARAMEVVGEFLVLGNIVGQGATNAGIIGTQEAGIHWCVQGDPTDWPDIGGSLAINGQSDYQVLQGDAGPITQIVAAADYTAVFRKRQVYRMDYVGAPNFFAFRKRDDSRGAIVPGTAIAVGNFVYFLSAEGFLIFNGATTLPIGFEKVDRTILGNMNWEDAESRCSVTHAATLRSIVWSLPQRGVGSLEGGTRGGRNKPPSGGTPGDGNSLFGYNYELKQWWTIQKDNEWVLNSPPFTSDLALDGAVYGPMVMDDPAPAGLGDVNLDTLGAGTSPRDALSVFTTNHKLASFTGSDTMVGTIITGDYEMPNTRRALVRSVRPVYSGTDAAITGSMFGRNLANGIPTSSSSRTMVASGVIPSRCAGRYQYVEFTTAGHIENFVGFDYKAGRLGQR